MSHFKDRLRTVKLCELLVPFKFQREHEPELSPLKEQILQFGILEPLVVKKEATGKFTVLSGRRRLEAVWELQKENHLKLIKAVPCYVVESPDPVTDLKIFLLLHSSTQLDPGDLDRITTMIEEATARPRRRRE